jgi:hypothetical protein
VVEADNLAYDLHVRLHREAEGLITHANDGRLFDASEISFQFGRDDVWTLFHSCLDFSVWEIWARCCRRPARHRAALGRDPDASSTCSCASA